MIVSHLAKQFKQNTMGIVKNRPERLIIVNLKMSRYHAQVGVKNVNCKK